MKIQSNNNINEVNFNNSYSASDSNTGNLEGRVFKKRRILEKSIQLQPDFVDTYIKLIEEEYKYNQNIGFECHLDRR